MNTSCSSWWPGVLDRGTPPDVAVPWRPEAGEDVARELRSGLLQRVVGDVVVAATAEPGPATRARALRLLLPAKVVVLAETALWVLHGPPIATPRTVQLAGARWPDLGSERPVRLQFSRIRPAPEEITEIAGLHLTTAARSLLDVAAATPHRARRLRNLLEAAGLIEPDAIDAANARARGRSNVRIARRALQLPPGPR